MGPLPAQASPLEELLGRIRGEYQETLSESLTPAQAQRLSGQEPVVCLAILDALLSEHLLTHTCSGRFVRRDP
jgi:hypothetical protein